jgi:hypothetical protein
MVRVKLQAPRQGRYRSKGLGKVELSATQMLVMPSSQSFDPRESLEDFSLSSNSCKWKELQHIHCAGGGALWKLQLLYERKA